MRRPAIRGGDDDGAPRQHFAALGAYEIMVTETQGAASLSTDGAAVYLGEAYAK